jgi:hypothetical protein
MCGVRRKGEYKVVRTKVTSSKLDTSGLSQANIKDFRHILGADCQALLIKLHVLLIYSVVGKLCRGNQPELLSRNHGSYDSRWLQPDEAESL